MAAEDLDSLLAEVDEALGESPERRREYGRPALERHRPLPAATALLIMGRSWCGIDITFLTGTIAPANTTLVVAGRWCDASSAVGSPRGL